MYEVEGFKVKAESSKKQHKYYSAVHENTKPEEGETFFGLKKNRKGDLI